MIDCIHCRGKGHFDNPTSVLGFTVCQKCGGRGQVDTPREKRRREKEEWQEQQKEYQKQEQEVRKLTGKILERIVNIYTEYFPGVEYVKRPPCWTSELPEKFRAAGMEPATDRAGETNMVLFSLPFQVYIEIDQAGEYLNIRCWNVIHLENGFDDDAVLMCSGGGAEKEWNPEPPPQHKEVFEAIAERIFQEIKKITK